MHLKPTEVTPKEKAEPEETTETKENKTLGAPTISNETKTTQENNKSEIDDKQYEYELLRTDYINKIEAQLVPAIRAINTVRLQEVEAKETNIKKEEKEKKKIQEKIKKKINKKQSKKETITSEDTDDRTKLEKNIDTNTNICKFLLKLLRKDETSINTKKITDIFMTHKMNEYRTNGKIAIDDKNRIKIMGSDGKETLATDEDYKNIMLEMMFEDEDESELNLNNEKDSTRLENFKFARFLFRLYYVVENNFSTNQLKTTPNDINGNDKFRENYKDIYHKYNDKNGSLKNALSFLEKEIDTKISKLKETNKKTNTQSSEEKFYSKIKSHITKLTNETIKTKDDAKELLSLLKNCTDDNKKSIAKDILGNSEHHPIFAEDKYFKIEVDDTNMMFK